MPFCTRFQTADFRRFASAGKRGGWSREVLVDRDVGLGGGLGEVRERVVDDAADVRRRERRG